MVSAYRYPNTMKLKSASSIKMFPYAFYPEPFLLLLPCPFRVFHPNLIIS